MPFVTNTRLTLLLTIGSLCSLMIISRTSAFLPSTTTSKYIQQQKSSLLLNAIDQNRNDDINNSNRREVLVSASMKAFALLIGAQVAIGSASPAFAGIDDLSMPSPDEQKKFDDVSHDVQN
jgi:hypothetical protein